MSTKQRGSGWSISLVFNFYKIFGYKFIYYLMYPVSFFYFIFASNVKESLKIYYKHLGIKFTNRLYFYHLRVFAICMVDRFISKVEPSSYKFIFKDRKTIEDNLSKGAILLFSHFGGWSTASNVSTVSNKINIVMKEALLDGIKEIENSIKSNDIADVNIIDLNESGIHVSIQIANALLNNEIVAMMADRAANDKYQKSMKFFGKDANFNKNPFQFAYKTKKPIFVFFIIYKDIQMYEVDCLQIDLDSSLDEENAIDEAMKIYISRFEKVLLQYPYQWFNFYNFWEN